MLYLQYCVKICSYHGCASYIRKWTEIFAAGVNHFFFFKMTSVYDAEESRRLDKINDILLELHKHGTDRQKLLQNLDDEFSTLEKIIKLKHLENNRISPTPSNKSFFSQFFSASLPRTKSSKINNKKSKIDILIKFDLVNIVLIIGTAILSIISSIKNFKSLENSWNWNLASNICDIIVKCGLYIGICKILDRMAQKTISQSNQNNKEIINKIIKNWHVIIS